jgi:hypothetical protein
MLTRNALQRAVVFFCSVFNIPEYGAGIYGHFRTWQVKVFFCLNKFRPPLFFAGILTRNEGFLPRAAAVICDPV